MFDIKEELKKLPQKPGVYIMKDADGAVIYVGKAVNLYNRVRQYFQSGNADDWKIRHLVPKITHFEYIVTGTDLEALVLENTLIKKHSPRYNAKLKDDKTYPYIKFTLNEDFPRVFMVRKDSDDRAKYYGPYTGVDCVSKILAFIGDVWNLRLCEQNITTETKRARPCLNYFIGKCKAPCCQYISKEDYGRIADSVHEFLNGKRSGVLSELEREMYKYSEEMEFEKAAEVRNKIAALKKLDTDLKLDRLTGNDRDVITFERQNDEALAQVFFIRDGKMNGREQFTMTGVESMGREEIMSAFLTQFYESAPAIPEEILLQNEPMDFDLTEKWLSSISGRKVTINVPKRGDKLKLVEMAAKNAVISFERSGDMEAKEKRKAEKALDEIKAVLGLKFASSLDRIEAYDISNISGVDTVASMVVFESGKPKRHDYRKFKIKTVSGADDYAAMEEVLTRRFTRYKDGDEKFGSLPGLLMIDGGKGQVTSAEKVLGELEIDVPVCGMVKDNKHRTRGLMYGNMEVTLPQASEGFKLATRIQDEVHRFAVEYHRKLREKAMTKSELDDIKGVGPTRRKALIKHFGSVEEVGKAGMEQLLEVSGMSRPAAAAVYNHFNKG